MPNSESSMNDMLLNALSIARQFCANPFDRDLSYPFEAALKDLTPSANLWSRSIVNVHDVENSGAIIEFFQYISSVIQLPNIPASLLAKIFHFIFEIAWCNPILRLYLEKKWRINYALSTCLVYNKSFSLNEQNLSLCLNLLHLFTYDTPVLWSNLMSSVMDYIVLRILDSDAENGSVMPSCLGILLNLCLNTPQAISYLNSQGKLNNLRRKFVSLLAADSMPTVICTLALVCYCFQDIRNKKLFMGKNLLEMFKCIVNVIVKSDSLLARFHAIDLLISLVKSSSNLLTNGVFTNQSLSPICELLVTRSGQPETLSKILELLLHCCKADDVREFFCDALVNAGPADSKRLTTPIIAVVEMARLAPDLSPCCPDLPCKSIRVLHYAISHLLENKLRISDYLSCEVVVQLVEDCLKTTLDTSHPLIFEKSERVYEGMRLAIMLSYDSTVRTDVLEIVHPALCSHIFQFQLSSNCCSLTSTSNASWSFIGVKIVFEVLTFLDNQSAFSKPHSLLYDDLLKDQRLLPFFVCGLLSNDECLIANVLRLITSAHGAIPSHIQHIAKLMSLWIQELKGEKLQENNRLNQNHDKSSPVVDLSAVTSERNNINIKNSVDEQQIKELDALLEKLKCSQTLDGRFSEIMNVYEMKITAVESENRQLQTELYSRIFNQQKNDCSFARFISFGEEAKKEAETLRQVLRKAEQKNDQLSEELKQKRSEINEQQCRIEQLKKSLDEKLNLVESLRNAENALRKQAECLEASLEVAQKEAESEKIMHGQIREHYSKMKVNFEAVSARLIEAKEDIKRMRSNIEKLKVDNAKQEEVNDQLVSKIANLEEELRKHSEIQEMIHKLTGRK
ncbi:Protein CIP2A [Trichinella pseudospiralis]|uniref:Protein CIP2A n=2 Tax=Trichinella pseudospiralis TaxID=6337 RepID=A0A0V1EGS3_TRIPS|nr:Protein CIP2A [Trichinella pseudospiralis]KRY83734.1 Protein CIP2A [Trichinella pseudospiralis]KRZ23199.1 Protein CIP2A [Trichinella pseudospiralis]KRZ35530.1 Protein CIP2A [Trichinella pseudospiralis]